MQWSYQRTVLLILLLANFGQFSARLVISPLIPDIVTTFEISRGSIGLALTGMWGVYALMQFPSGVLADRFGERKIILMSLILIITANTLLALSSTFLMFTIFVLALGIGSGFFFTVAASLIDRLFEHTGQTLGLLTSGAMIAGLIGPVFAVAIASRQGWRSGVLFASVVLFPTVIIATRYIQPIPPEQPSLAVRQAMFRPRQQIINSLSRPAIIYTTILASVAMFIFQATTTFFPMFLVEYHGFTTQAASITFGFIFIVSAVGTPTLGDISDRIGRDAVLATIMLSTIIGFIIILLKKEIAVVIIGVGAVAVGMTWFGVINARYMDQISNKNRGTEFGLARTIYTLIGALGSVITGSLADLAGWFMAFGLLAILASITIIAIVLNYCLRLKL